MSTNASTSICTHIKVNGVRCGSPALREEIFCYFHQRMIRGVPTPPKSRLHPIAMLEDAASIQASLMEIVNALIRNQIDLPRARLIIRALQIAQKNARDVHFHFSKEQMVTEVPEYPAAPPPAGPFSVPAVQAAALANVNAPQEEEETEAERFADLFSKPPFDKPNGKPPSRASGNRPTSPTRTG